MTIAEIMAAMTACMPAKRGSLHEQYFTGSQGKRNGPYYVLTRSVGGKTKSTRVRADQVGAVQAEIENGKRLEELMESIWEIAESTGAGSPKKKQRCSRSNRL